MTSWERCGTCNAIQSSVKQLEAVAWYSQRVDAYKDEELEAGLAQNRDEREEHASRVLEWIWRRDATS